MSVESSLMMVALILLADLSLPTLRSGAVKSISFSDERTAGNQEWLGQR